MHIPGVLRKAVGADPLSHEKLLTGARPGFHAAMRRAGSHQLNMAEVCALQQPARHAGIAASEFAWESDAWNSGGIHVVRAGVTCGHRRAVRQALPRWIVLTIKNTKCPTPKAKEPKKRSQSWSDNLPQQINAQAMTAS